MKNLFLTAALVLALSANATSISKDGISVSTEIKQEKEYKKVEPTAVPAPVLKEISTKYGGYTIKEAYASEDGEYKLVVAKDKKSVTVYYTASGEFVKEQA